MIKLMLNQTSNRPSVRTTSTKPAELDYNDRADEEMRSFNLIVNRTLIKIILEPFDHRNPKITSKIAIVT